MEESKNFTHGSLFSGIGGFDLAAEWMGWENVFHCEWNPFGKKILNYYWPNAISYDDITKTDFTKHRGAIDVLSGGFPCQPYSVAGKRKGKDDERHLWPHMRRAIREIQPKWVVGENVLGLVSWNDGMVFEEVQADLESEGYKVQPFILPAAGVNAPHQRYRVWFVAYSIGNGNSGEEPRSDAAKERMEGVDRSKDGSSGKSFGANFDDPKRHEQVEYVITNTESNGNRRILSGLETEDDSHRQSKKHWESDGKFGNVGSQRNDTNAINQRLQGCKNIGGFGGYRKNGEKQSPRFFQSNWQEFPTQPPLCNGNDGVSGELDGITFSKWRNESIKAGGNAIVPQVVLQIFKAIEQHEQIDNQN